MGGDPLLKLLAVDFLKAEKKFDNVALHPNCLVQVNFCHQLFMSKRNS